MTARRTISTSAGLLLSVAISLRRAGHRSGRSNTNRAKGFHWRGCQIQSYRKSFGRHPGRAGGDELDGSRRAGRARIWIRRKIGRRIPTSSPPRNVKKHPLGRDPNAPLALALGASIEVEGNVMAARGERCRSRRLSARRAQEILRYVDSRAHSKGGQPAEPGRQAGARAGWYRDSQGQAGAPVLLGALVSGL